MFDLERWIANFAGATALILSLGFLALPVSAACPVGNANCGGGGGGGGGATITFSVAIVGDPDASVGLSPRWLPTCTAQTNSGTDNGLDSTAIFPRHDLCATLTTSTGATLTDDIIVHTVVAKSGQITGVQVMGQDIIGDAGIVHLSDVLPLISPVIPDVAGFTLHVHATDVPLWKCDTHLLKKRSNCDEWVGTFTLDDMVYTPDP